MNSWKLDQSCKYAKSDEWIRVEGDQATVGITDYAQDKLSDLVFIELPKIGAKFAAGRSFGVVESVKAAADLNMPVGGEIIEVNLDLGAAPETINHDAFGKGWVIRIKGFDSLELNALMDAATYETYCNERG